MGPSPYAFLQEISTGMLSRTLCNFKHRFTTGSHLVSLMIGIKKLVLKYGSLNECFCAGVKRSDGTVLRALDLFAGHLNCSDNYLIPSPAKRSACKRLNLFLRWMVRKDAVDPGGWKGVSRKQLIVPLDTHMARIGRTFELTSRKSANIGMALDITAAFREAAPGDPVKYDFALTRLGIREELDMQSLL